MEDSLDSDHYMLSAKLPWSESLLKQGPVWLESAKWGPELADAEGKVRDFPGRVWGEPRPEG